MHSFRVPFPTLPSILSLYVANSHLPGEAKHETLGSLSDAFEQHTSTGCGPFSPLICLDATEFVFLSVFTLTYRDNIYPKICSRSWLKSAKSPLPVDVH